MPCRPILQHPAHWTIGAIALIVVGTSAALASTDDDVWTRFPNMNSVTALAESDSEIFVGTTGGVRRFDRFFSRWLQPITTSDGLPSNQVRAMVYDRASGELWIDTVGGSGAWHTRLESFSLGAGNPDFSPQPPLRIPPVVTPFGYFLDGHRIIGPRATYAVTAALIDSWDTLWLGTSGMGVGRAELSNEQLSFIRYGPIESNVTSLARDGDDIWIGGGDLYNVWSHGITRYDVVGDEWHYLEPERRSGDFDDLRITDILPLPDHVFFSTRMGLIRYHRAHERWDFYRLPREHPGGIGALVRDGKRIWMATEAGLALFDIKAEEIRRVEGSERFLIRGLAADDAWIWAATDQGLYRCLRGRAVWQPVGGTQSVMRRTILAVAAGTDGLWAAVESPPRVIRVVADGSGGDSLSVQEMTMVEVWGSRRVRIQADSARVWVGTDRGIHRLDRKRGEWKHFTSYEGLLGDEIQALLLDGGSIWFGTAQGLTRYRWADDFFEATD